MNRRLAPNRTKRVAPTGVIELKSVSNNVDTGTTPQSRGANAAPFISYIAVHAKDEEADPDGLAHEQSDGT